MRFLEPWIWLGLFFLGINTWTVIYFWWDQWSKAGMWPSETDVLTSMSAMEWNGWDAVRRGLPEQRIQAKRSANNKEENAEVSQAIKALDRKKGWAKRPE